MRQPNQPQTAKAEAKARDAAIQICNSQPITAEILGGVTYYSATRRGVEYTAYVLCGQWFVATHRASLGRQHVGGGRYYKTLHDLAAGCKAFAALPVFLALGTI